MSNCLCFRCRRLVDLDPTGQEIDEPNNYGYTFFNDEVEVLSVGMSKEEMATILQADVSSIIRILKEIDDDGDRASLLNSLTLEGGLYVNGYWNEWVDTDSSAHDSGRRKNPRNNGVSI